VKRQFIAKGLFICLFAFLCSPVSALSKVTEVTRYINRGNLITVKNTIIPYLAFDSTIEFNANSAPIKIGLGDTLQLTIINRDTASHTIRLGTWESSIINIGDSIKMSYSSSEEKIDIYFDPTGDQAYLGLVGMIEVTTSAANTYTWNLHSHEQSFSQSLVNGLPVDWSQYYPDYFTVNALSFPQLQADAESKVRARVGDTVLIFIANAGRSIHSLHFHGFHCKVRYTSASRLRRGWVKDTFPLGPLESLLLELVPDKIGRYSVHDHNLVAITAGGTHPNGMFTIMEVQP
jgi:FtsP/CotA-like multicopper oxidase with cupredoxin domain